MGDEPRIPPLPPDEWGDELKPLLEATPPRTQGRLGDNNIFATFARNPDLFKAWLPFGGYLLAAGKLSGPDRELLILRTAVRCGSSYEWGQHVRIDALRRGATGAFRDRPRRRRVRRRRGGAITRPPCGAAPTSCTTTRGSPTPRWATLSGYQYDEAQLIEATILVGQYHLVALRPRLLRRRDSTRDWSRSHRRQLLGARPVKNWLTSQ